jgi:ubiquinone/menaquinone biosynthesis C-methylase UbiE
MDGIDNRQSMIENRPSVSSRESAEDTGERLDAFARWLRAAHSPAHSRRTAAANAAFLLPLLKPGMRVLDAGCGPGSITLGLAAAVAPGEAAGIDLSAEAIVSAQAAASAAGVANVRFEQASIYALPFADGAFDVAFAHAVFQHLEAPVEAARELYRVLKPGGIVALADADYGGSIIAPATPALDASIELMERVRAHSGGDPRIGRRLGTLLAEAGFEGIRCSASAGVDGSVDAAERTGEFWGRYFEAAEFVTHVTVAGWADAAALSAMAAAWRTWGQSPGAFWARFWCEAVGSR